MALSGGSGEDQRNITNYFNSNGTTLPVSIEKHRKKLFVLSSSSLDSSTVPASSSMSNNNNELIMQQDEVEVEVAASRQHQLTQSDVSSTSENQTIQTLVFIDLEATGLKASSEKSRIMEIGIVAVAVTEFLDLQSKLSTAEKVEDVSVRVLNKLILCLNPSATVMPNVTDLTGLNNYNLESQSKFTSETAQMLDLFVRHLPKPACFVAHHGLGFDFPLLRSELVKLDADLDVLVVDSLHALKFIIAAKDEAELCRPETSHGSSTLDDFSTFQPLDPIHDATEVFTHREVYEGSQYPSATSTPVKAASGGGLFSSYQLPQTPTTTTTSLKRPRSDSEESSSKSVNSKSIHPAKVIKLLDSNEEDHADFGVTPDRSHAMPQVEPNAPVKVRKFAERRHTESAVSSFSGSLTNNRSHLCRARKRLFVTSPPKSFSLTDLHQHFFGRPPVTSHTAEDDCFALMRVCAAHGKAFVNYIQAHAVPFSSVQRMW